jgi:hypothetical protein
MSKFGGVQVVTRFHVVEYSRHVKLARNLRNFNFVVQGPPLHQQLHLEGFFFSSSQRSFVLFQMTTIDISSFAAHRHVGFARKCNGDHRFHPYRIPSVSTHTDLIDHTRPGRALFIQ